MFHTHIHAIIINRESLTSQHKDRCEEIIFFMHNKMLNTLVSVR